MFIPLFVVNVGARVANHPPREAWVVGVGMLPRAGVELVVVTGALATGIVDERLFSAVLELVVVSAQRRSPSIE